VGFLIRRWALAAALAGAAAGGCKKRPPTTENPVTIVARDAGTISAGDPPSAGSLVAERFEYALAIYHLPVPKVDPLRELKKLVRGRPIALVGPKGKTPSGPSVRLERAPVEKFPPPDLAERPHSVRGLSDAEKSQLRESRALTILWFEGPGDQALSTYRIGLELVRDLAAKTGGLAWDEETREVFGQEEWSKRARHFGERFPDMRSHVALHLYRDGELFRLVTIGMGKFALPDVSVNEVSSSDSSRMGDLVNLACQTMIEKGRLEREGELTVSLDGVEEARFRESISEDLKPNAKRKAALSLAIVERQEGDAENRLFEIVFPGSAAALQERQGALLADLFGFSDEVVHFEKHDEEVLAASRRAKKAAFRMRDRYADGPPFGERLMVKAPFKTTSDANEWMWVEVVRWRGDAIDGILQNDPVAVPDLRAGARVEVRADAIFDYLLVKDDGSEEGNETGKLLHSRKRNEE
jgi:uncharacterized protein YegJ (DUF2314 family)